MTIRTIIVDDEPLARTGLRNRLRAHPDIEIMCECGDGAEAIERIESLEPDLVFLDIEMPALGGFGVIDELDGDVPAVVFVTAYDEYAVRAFGVDAVDYLLKPVDDQAFERALDRARKRIGARHAADLPSKHELERLLLEYRESRDADEAAQRYLTRIFIRDGDRGFFVRTSEVSWVQTADNYLRIATGGREYLIRATMQELEQKLDPREFARIHRRTLVNLDCVQDISTDFRGHHIVRMKDGASHRLSRTFRDRILGRTL